MHARFVDFHCHLDLYPNLHQAIAYCDASSTATLAVTTTPKAWFGNVAAARGSLNVRVALGFHPQLAQEREDELPLFLELLPQARYVGEIGLDAGPRYYRTLAAQERVLRGILSACRDEPGRVLSMHSVRAVRRLLDLIEEYNPGNTNLVVLHWFTGSISEAKRAIDLGCYFSLNNAMLGSARASDLISALPIDRILTETDGPFTMLGGATVQPGDVSAAVARLAVLVGTDCETARVQILDNLKQMLGSIHFSNEYIPRVDRPSA
jgi:TatD DNase family protein